MNSTNCESAEDKDKDCLESGNAPLCMHVTSLYLSLHSTLETMDEKFFVGTITYSDFVNENRDAFVKLYVSKAVFCSQESIAQNASK
jgi:hypothetical protein